LAIRNGLKRSFAPMVTASGTMSRFDEVEIVPVVAPGALTNDPHGRGHDAESTEPASEPVFVNG